MSLIQSRNNGEHTSCIIECNWIDDIILQDSHTLIHLASSDGHVELVEKFITSGADVNVADGVSVNYTKCLLSFIYLRKNLTS